ncbi:MAG: hypothetical protein ACT4PU_11565 [Planctomycetota bacterium]
MAFVTVAVVLAAACQASLAPQLPPCIVLPAAAERVEAWREDLAFLAQELPRRHARPFGVVSEERFRAAALELERRIPELDDAAVVIGLNRLTASIGDGHTGFRLHSPRLGFRVHPLWLMSFSDGIFVKGAVAPNLDGLNGRLVRIGALTVDEARARLAPLISRDNALGLLDEEGACLTRGEVLVAIGAAETPEQASFGVVDAQGHEHVLESRALPDGERPPLAVSYAAGGSAPFAERLRREGRPYAFARLEEGRTVYLQYNACRDADAFEAFCDEVFASIDAPRPERLIVDLRWNSGGDSAVSRALDRALSDRPWLDNRLIALIGRGTFSSGMWAAIDLQAEHGAILVGEPTGGRPHAPGDVRTIVLPRSTLEVSVATRLWSKGGARYAGEALEPDFLVSESSADHFAGRDPVLEAALALSLRLSSR